jgi:Ca2+/Na+ antiporter
VVGVALPISPSMCFHLRCTSIPTRPAHVPPFSPAHSRVCVCVCVSVCFLSALLLVPLSLCVNCSLSFPIIALAWCTRLPETTTRGQSALLSHRTLRACRYACDEGCDVVVAASAWHCHSCQEERKKEKTRGTSLSHALTLSTLYTLSLGAIWFLPRAPRLSRCLCCSLCCCP